MDNTTIHVGHHTLVGPNCSLYTVNHAIDADEREKGLCVDKPIHIGQPGMAGWKCSDNAGHQHW